MKATDWGWYLISCHHFSAPMTVILLITVKSTLIRVSNIFHASFKTYGDILSLNLCFLFKKSVVLSRAISLWFNFVDSVLILYRNGNKRKKNIIIIIQRKVKFGDRWLFSNFLLVNLNPSPFILYFLFFSVSYPRISNFHSTVCAVHFGTLSLSVLCQQLSIGRYLPLISLVHLNSYSFDYILFFTSVYSGRSRPFIFGIAPSCFWILFRFHLLIR